jgi:peptide/nickel transport system substrate-binding protein
LTEIATSPYEGAQGPADRGKRHRTTMTKYALLRPLALATLVASASACRPEQSDGEFPRNQTMYVGGRQWGPPSTFNPLEGQASWPLMGYDGSNLLYETLLVFNPLDGSMQPLLAASFVIKDDRIDVVLQEKARWSDGKPLTGWDVKYTFDIANQHRSLPHGVAWTYLKSVDLPEASDPAHPPPHPRQVSFVLNERRNSLVMLDVLQQTRVVPKHVIEPMFAAAKNDPNEFLKNKFDKNPVVSGPYTLHSYSDEKIVTVRRDDYWGNEVFFEGKKPAPKFLIHSIFKSNEAFSVGLRQGTLDMSTSFVPRIWLKYPKGVRSWYDKPPYFLSSVQTTLFVNVLNKPLDDPHYRRAMAFSIDYKDIRELAVSGYSEPIKSGLILPFGLEAKYFSEEDVSQYGASVFDPARAKEELKLGGYKPVFNADGELVETLDASGKRMPTVFIKSPSGWTDWESIVRIVVRSMRAVGIDARERFIDGSLFWTAVFGGDFDLIMYNPHPTPTPSKPWSRFEFNLTSEEWAPVGDKMFKNFGRFNSPKSPAYIKRFDELIQLIPTLKDEAERVKAYRELNVLFMQHQPVIPLVYRADQFYEFSTRAWQGYPTSEHPFLPPQMPADRLGTRILWHLKPAAGN